MKIGVFLINLDDRKDRLDSSVQQLSKIELQFTRVSAVSAKDVEKSTFLTEPVVACWKSHIKTYRILVESDVDYALVLEDDFLVKNPRKFSKLLRNLDLEKYDLLQLGFLLPGIFNRIRWIFEELEKLIFYSLGFVSKNFRINSLSQRLRIAEARNTSIRFTQSSFLPGTHAYLINREMASALILLDSPQFSADEFFTALSKMRSFRMVRFWRSLITQSNSTPSISNRFVNRGEK
jgi:GR25 family glycosyltransferase involved in LPS biosynthesis